MSGSDNELAQAFLTRAGIEIDRAEALARLLAPLPRCSFAIGARLCIEEERHGPLLWLTEGEVRVEKVDLAGVTRKLATLDAPYLLGHMGVVGRTHRSAGVRACTPCTVAIMEEAAAHALLEDQGPGGAVFRELILASMVAQLTRGTTRIRAITGQSMAMGEDPDAARLLEVSAELEGWTNRQVQRLLSGRCHS